MGRIIGGAIVVLVIAVALVAAYPLVSPRSDAPARQTEQWMCDETFAGDVADYAAGHDGIDAIVVMRGTELVHAVGHVELPINTHGARAAVLSLLYGIAQAERLIDLRATLGSLSLDERVVPLTSEQRKLRVRDLLESPAPDGDTSASDDGSSVDLLGVILEQVTGRTIGTLIDEWLARPAGLRDFVREHVIADVAADSRYPAFAVFMSARDLARLGALFLSDGRSGDVQVVPSAWLDESTTRYSNVDDVEFEGFGYLWWLDDDFDTVWARGWGGQFMSIDRANELVVVSRTDTGRRIGEILDFRFRGKHSSREHHQAIYERALAALSDAC